MANSGQKLNQDANRLYFLCCNNSQSFFKYPHY